jgi:glucose/mannose-6-phosphate isomerase
MTSNASPGAHVLLDDPAERGRLDPSDMVSRIAALPDQCETRWRELKSLQLPNDLAAIDQLVVLGMGGSAIAGDILGTLARYSGRKAVRVVRGYTLPSDVQSSALAVACSHSGNTDETLALLGEALDRRVPLVAVTTGGQLSETAERSGFPVISYTFDGEPRSALGHQLMALLAIAEQTGVLTEQDAVAGEAVALMRDQRTVYGPESRFEDNPAKQLAARLAGRIPIVIGAGTLVEAAHRWRTQFSENSKCWAFSDELPELAHNTIVGFSFPTALLPSLYVIFLRHASLDVRVSRALAATCEELDLAGIAYEAVDAQGASPLAQVMTSLFFGDFVSYYLALLYGTDPSPVPPIVRLKEKLAGH